MPISKRTLAGIVGLLFIAPFLGAQFSGNPDGIPQPAPDPQIAAAVGDVSPARIQQTIEKLVSFGTRQTISSETPAASGKGVNAAAEWIKSQFEEYSKACG